MAIPTLYGERKLFISGKEYPIESFSFDFGEGLTTLSESNVNKEKEMKYYTELPRKNWKEVNLLVQEEAFKKGWRSLNEDSNNYTDQIASGYTDGSMCLSFGYSTSSREDNLDSQGIYFGKAPGAELIPWYDIIEGKLPSPKKDIKAYRITNPENEDLFKAVQKRFFEGGVGWRGTGETFENYNNVISFQITDKSITDGEVYSLNESNIQTIPYDQFLKEGIPGVLPTKEQHEAEKERLKWEAMRGKLVWVRDCGGEAWKPAQLTYYIKNSNYPYKTTVGGWKFCKPLTPDEIDAMTYRGQE